MPCGVGEGLYPLALCEFRPGDHCNGVHDITADSWFSFLQFLQMQISQVLLFASMVQNM